jgi:signal transduction histidine kinase
MRRLNVPRRTFVVVVALGVAAIGVVCVVGTLLGEMLGPESPLVIGRSLALSAGGLLALAAVVAWAAAREAAGDVRHVAEGVLAMTRDGDEAVDWGRSVPVRSLDEVGELTLEVERLRSYFLGSLERERQARRRAEEADHFNTEFLRTVSHELKTPLNSILGFTDVLEAEIDGPLTPSQREDIEVIRRAGRYLMALFQDVLDLSAATSGHLELEREPVDLHALLNDLASELKGQVVDRSVKLRVDVAPGLPPVDGDQKRLRQIVSNLASNALKFTERGEVVLGAYAGNGSVVVRVRDTGPGIEAEQLAVIFEEFEQTEGESERRRGAGLGLAIARQLTLLHQGSLTVDSEVGVGSTFSVELPLWRPT